MATNENENDDSNSVDSESDNSDSLIEPFDDTSYNNDTFDPFEENENEEEEDLLSRQRNYNLQRYDLDQYVTRINEDYNEDADDLSDFNEEEDDKVYCQPMTVLSP